MEKKKSWCCKLRIHPLRTMNDSLLMQPWLRRYLAKTEHVVLWENKQGIAKLIGIQRAMRTIVLSCYYLAVINKEQGYWGQHETLEKVRIKARAQSCAKTKVSTEVMWGNVTPEDQMKREEKQKVFAFSFTEPFAQARLSVTLLKSSRIHMKEHATCIKMQAYRCRDMHRSRLLSVKCCLLSNLNVSSAALWLWAPLNWKHSQAAAPSK